MCIYLTFQPFECRKKQYVNDTNFAFLQSHSLGLIYYRCSLLYSIPVQCTTTLQNSIRIHNALQKWDGGVEKMGVFRLPCWMVCLCVWNYKVIEVNEMRSLFLVLCGLSICRWVCMRRASTTTISCRSSRHQQLIEPSSCILKYIRSILDLCHPPSSPTKKKKYKYTTVVMVCSKFNFIGIYLVIAMVDRGSNHLDDRNREMCVL